MKPQNNIYTAHTCVSIYIYIYIYIVGNDIGGKIAAQISSLSIMTHTLMSLVSVSEPPNLSKLNLQNSFSNNENKFGMPIRMLAARLYICLHALSCCHQNHPVFDCSPLQAADTFVNSKRIANLHGNILLNTLTPTAAQTLWNRLHVGHVSAVQDQDRESGYREHVRTPSSLYTT